MVVGDVDRSAEVVGAGEGDRDARNTGVGDVEHPVVVPIDKHRTRQTSRNQLTKVVSGAGVAGVDGDVGDRVVAERATQ